MCADFPLPSLTVWALFRERSSPGATERSNSRRNKHTYGTKTGLMGRRSRHHDNNNVRCGNMRRLVRMATLSGEVVASRGMQAHSISALILRRAHLARETLAFPSREKSTSVAGRRLPETGDGRSAISADRARVCLCAHVCAHVGEVIKMVRSHYSCWRRGEDSRWGTLINMYKHS